MRRLLIADDDSVMRRLFRARLSPAYEIIETSEADEVLKLVLESRPAAIFLDLMMPRFSGFELCQSLHSLSYTADIPIFIVSGVPAAQYKEQCGILGARDYFEKPVDFLLLKHRLSEELLKFPEEPHLPAARRFETILLVEEKPELRALSKRLLEAGGYSVLEAGNSQEALRLVRQRKDAIHLLLTDFAAPGINGRTLAKKLKYRRPELKVLYMQNHDAGGMAAKNDVESGRILLQKPFSSESLQQKVREVLEDHEPVAG
jgi:CheY-like chemotaxis protein